MKNKTEIQNEAAVNEPAVDSLIDVYTDDDGKVTAQITHTLTFAVDLDRSEFEEQVGGQLTVVAAKHNLFRDFKNTNADEEDMLVDFNESIELIPVRDVNYLLKTEAPKLYDRYLQLKANADSRGIYWFFTSKGELNCTYNYGTDLDNKRKEAGNWFTTHLEAVEQARTRGCLAVAHAPKCDIVTPCGGINELFK